jgi:cytochrome c oxidase subunit 4
MSDANNTHEVIHEHEKTMSIARIWRVFWILLIITVVEVIWGMKVSHTIPEAYKWVNAIFFLSMTFVKAGYIVAEFMHLRYEVTNMLRSVLIPLLLFIWFVVAFCMDGDSWLNLRKRYAPGDQPKAAPPTEVQAEPLK